MFITLLHGPNPIATNGITHHTEATCIAFPCVILLIMHVGFTVIIQLIRDLKEIYQCLPTWTQFPFVNVIQYHYYFIYFYD